MGEATTELARIELSFGVVHESDDSFSRWKQLLARHRIQGVSVHDARLVSVMLAQNITHLLTFDTGDFARYTEIIAIHPTELAEGAFALAEMRRVVEARQPPAREDRKPGVEDRGGHVHNFSRSQFQYLPAT